MDVAVSGPVIYELVILVPFTWYTMIEKKPDIYQNKQRNKAQSKNKEAKSK